MNIKNPEAYRLARQLAQLTGETLTNAVTTSVRERLERVQRQDNEDYVERLLAIGRDCASRLGEPWRSIDHGELLYDGLGLPK